MLSAREENSMAYFNEQDEYAHIDPVMRQYLRAVPFRRKDDE